MRSHEYVEGDGDMLLLELATEKLYDDLSQADFLSYNMYSLYGLWETNQTLYEDILKDTDGNKDIKTIEGGFSAQFIYFLTGKEIEYNHHEEEIEKSLEEFKNGNLALTCGFVSSQEKSYVVAKDINDNDVYLECYHSYSISNVTDESVTIINPWDTSQEITIAIDSFIKEIDRIEKCNLEGNDVNYLKEPDEIDDEGNKIYRTERELYGFLPITDESTFNKDGKKISSRELLFGFIPWWSA